ncbi:MAG: hypothetical protein JWO06_3369 [Bacteroidota bacterium]|nr:hypothetical protein [Bacteroidota bacterium]
MAAVVSFNPYEGAGPIFTNGLDYIAANLPVPATLADLNDTVLAYYGTLTPPPGADALDIVKTVIPNSANQYINKQIGQNLNFDSQQLDLVYSINNGIKESSIESLANLFDLALEDVTTSCISDNSKISVYLALELATASVAYWNGIVTMPGNWASYISSNAAINYANIPNWVAASFVGAFSGFSQVQYVNIQNVDSIIVQSREWDFGLESPELWVLLPAKLFTNGHRDHP